MARVYAIILIIIFVGASLAYALYSPSFFFTSPFIKLPYAANTDSHLISNTWQEFLADCGGEVVVENYVHARSLFNKKYEGNQVAWTGFVAGMRTQSSGGPHVFGSDHAMSLYIRMQPSESNIYPDLVLSVSTRIMQEYKHLLLSQSE